MSQILTKNNPTAGDNDVRMSIEPAPATQSAMQLHNASRVTQSSPLLRLPGELRNEIYTQFLNPPSTNVDLFSEAHSLATTCHKLRSEFWPYFLSRAIFRLDLRVYSDFFDTFYPTANARVMGRYVGTFNLWLKHRTAGYISEVTSEGKGETVDLLPLICLLRASPGVNFTLDASGAWVCSRRRLRDFLRHVKSSETWVVAPLIQSLRLRLREAQMGESWASPVFWIVDVRLKRDLRFVYEQMGLLAYLEQRGDEGRDGITFHVMWDREEVKETRVKKLSFERIKKGIKKAWGRFHLSPSLSRERFWFGP